MDHNGGDGREKATFKENAFVYSYGFDRQTNGLATCFVDADYIINMALMKGHVTQGVTLVSKNFFGCLDIETDWRKNAHGTGFSQSQEGKRQYSVYPDFMGHKDLGEKTILYLLMEFTEINLLMVLLHPNGLYPLSIINGQKVYSLRRTL